MTEKALPDFSRAMIALLLDESDRALVAERVAAAFEGAFATLIDPNIYHVTIANLGPLTLTDVARIQDEFRYNIPKRVSGVIGGAGYFTPGDEAEPVIILHFDAPQLASVKGHIDYCLSSLGIFPAEDHGFTPHITVAHSSDTSVVERLNFNNQPLIFNRLYLVADEFIFPLGVDPLREEDSPVKVAPAPMKSYELTDEGDLHIFVYGVPFGGPEYLDGKDLDNEYFDKSTDIGPLPYALSFWDHAKVSDDPFYKQVGEYFGNDPIGIAERVGMDENGWIYKIIVDRRKKYLQLLKRLAEERLIGASSTPFQRSAQKSADGHWEKWHVVEVALTPTQANPLAEIAKSITEEFLAGDNMAKSKTNPEEVVETPTEQEAAPDVAENKDTVADQIGKIFTEADEDTSEPEVETVAQMLEKVFDRLDEIDQKLEKALAVEAGIEEIKAAFPALAKNIKTMVVGGVSRQGQSEAEEEAEAIVREKTSSRRSPQAPRKTVSYLPPDAPGLN